MARRPNSLLLGGAGSAWARITAAEHAARPAAGVTPVEELLRRGQALSSQAAALRRAMSDGPRA